MTSEPDAAVERFVNAIAQYQTAQREQTMNFATRPPADLGKAAADVRSALAALMADLN